MVDIKQTSIHSGVIPFTPIAASSTQAAISDTNVQSAINTISTELKTLSNLTSPPEIVTVTGVIFPIVFPTPTLTGVPLFLPNTPTNTNATYEITDGVSVVYSKWNGTQYTSAPTPVLQNNVRYGTNVPTVLAIDKIGHEYLRTPSGTSATTAIESYVFNGTLWSLRPTSGISNKIKQVVNAGVVVQLDNIKVRVPTTLQSRGYEIGVVTTPMTFSLTAETNYGAGSWFSSQIAAVALTTVFTHPTGWAGQSSDDYAIIRLRNGSDIYIIEIWTGIGFNNNIIIIEKK